LPIAIGLALLLLTRVADATSTTCSTSAVCAEYINSSSGVAIHGEANTGIGIRGTSNGSTGFYGASRSGNLLFPGVEGESLNQSGNDAAGAFGLAATTGGGAPAYGVLAYGSLIGVYGTAAGAGNGSKGVPTTFGVAGYDAFGQAGQDTNVAVLGETAHGTAMFALAHQATSSSNVYDDRLPVGVAAEAEPESSGGSAVAVKAYSKSVPFLAQNTTSGLAVDLAAATYEIYARDFTVDDVGNVLADSVTTAHGTYARTTGSSGTIRIASSATAAAPVIEDSGEGRLVNGRGYVTLDPAFSDVIDKRSAYRVFLTAEGDGNVLYVMQKSPAGFLVRESRGGRSTLSFDYRIIAKPVDEDGTRLALAPPRPQPDFESQHHRAVHPASSLEPLDPFARLESRIGPAAYRSAISTASSTTCTTSAVCAEYINSSSGVAIHGEANTGIGIRGTSNGSTGFYGASRSGSLLFPGVEGESLNQNGEDVAAGFGLTAASGGAAPTYGVVALGSGIGVYGNAFNTGLGAKDMPTAFGAVGVDGGGAAGLDTNVAVVGETRHGTGMLALANVTTATTAVYDDTEPVGVAAEAEPEQSTSLAIALEAVSKAAPLRAYNPQLGFIDLATQYDLISAGPGSSGNSAAFVVDNSANVFAEGQFTTQKGTYARTTGSSGTTRIAYTARTAARVMEDSGEAQLVNGRAYVKLDPAFADVIEKRSPYRVFVTPEGDSDGLYVTQKSPAGFVVRESSGGRSTFAFDYRIVATPVDDDGRRLALAPPLHQPDFEHRHLPSTRPATPQQPLDPVARLRSRIGPAKFARELEAAKKIETVP
jgi:hypothetical protein